MTATETLSEELVYRIAPNGKAAQAGLDLAQRGAFSQARISPDRTWLGASCQGSERQPYAVQVDLRDPARVATSCTCPSYQQPCKHALGLLMLAARFPAQLETAEPSAPPKKARGREPGKAEVEPRPAAEALPEPSSLEEAFLQAIFAEPAEDTHRLAYADWLEEHGGPAGQARAEFIRVQIELARLAPDDARGAELRKREKKLWEANRSSWLEAVPRSLRRPDLSFHRGFLEEMHLTAAALLRHGEALFRQHPIRRVHLDDQLQPQEASKLAVCPFLARLTALSFPPGGYWGGYWDLTVPRVLLGTPYLAQLTELRMARSGLGRRGAALLAASPVLKNLRTLDLEDCDLGDLGVGSLLTAPDLGRLTTLRLGRNRIANPGVAALLASPRLSNLNELSLADNRFGPKAAQALADAPHLANLTSLELQGNKIGVRAAEALRRRFGGRVRLE
jgi:uncharacterized protein (TIGR02996 family)